MQDLVLSLDGRIISDADILGNLKGFSRNCTIHICVKGPGGADRRAAGRRGGSGGRAVMCCYSDKRVQRVTRRQQGLHSASIDAGQPPVVQNSFSRRALSQSRHA